MSRLLSGSYIYAQGELWGLRRKVRLLDNYNRQLYSLLTKLQLEETLLLSWPSIFSRQYGGQALDTAAEDNVTIGLEDGDLDHEEDETLLVAVQSENCEVLTAYEKPFPVEVIGNKASKSTTIGKCTS